MATALEIVRGDSYVEDFINKTVLPADPGYADWTGTWAIIDKLESTTTPFATGSLSKPTDPNLRLRMQILPAQSLAVPVGRYKLVVEVTNTTLNFTREVVQRDLKITAKGI